MSDSNEKAAISLGYDQTSAPKVVAKGYNQLAEEIINQAREMGVLVYQDKTLLAMLDHLSLDEEIPEQLYVIVAELISFSYLMQGKFPKNWKNPHNKVDDKA